VEGDRFLHEDRLVARVSQPQREVDVLEVGEEHRLRAAERADVVGTQQAAPARPAEDGRCLGRPAADRVPRIDFGGHSHHVDRQAAAVDDVRPRGEP